MEIGVWIEGQEGVLEGSGGRVAAVHWLLLVGNVCVCLFRFWFVVVFLCLWFGMVGCGLAVVMCCAACMCTLEVD